MSKLSPYGRSNHYRKDHSPLSNHYENTPAYHKKLGSIKQAQQYPHKNQTKYKATAEDVTYNVRPTEKKKHEHYSNQEIDVLLDKNRQLAKENAELYQMLEERGRIVTALEKKLEEQMFREVKTLEEIEREKNKFINDSHRKFKDYQIKIEQLIEQIYVLNEEKYQQNMIKAHEIDLIKDNFAKEQTLKIHELALNQLSAREEGHRQQKNAQALLELKNTQMQQLQQEYETCIDQLKKEISALNKEIIHLNHIRKIQLSEQKIMYDHMIENMTKEHIKQKELVSMEHDLLVKKLQQMVSCKEIEACKLGELLKVGEINQSVREQQLLEKKTKLEEEIRDLEEFYRRKAFNEAQKLKDLTLNEVQALEKGTSALHDNLKDQITNLIQLNTAKTEEINKLYAEISLQRQQTAELTSNFQKIIDQLKQKVKDIERQHSVEMEQLKVKLAELSQADISTLKDYYQHELEVLRQQVNQKAKLAQSHRQKLHYELQDKNQMRKRYDLETLKLNTRISELQLYINELALHKKQEASSLNAAMHLTSSKLLREANDKEKVKQTNEQEKRKLQEIITTKDRQIEQLNNKIRLMRQNYSKEMAQKNAQVQIIKKHKEDLEMELKKEKYFYDNELKKKDAVIKSNKDLHEDQVALIKGKFRKQYDSMVTENTSKLNNLEVEINRLKGVEKTLRSDIVFLKQSQQTEIADKKEEIQVNKGRYEQDKKTIEDKLKRYYTEEIKKLQEEVQELKKQLGYREEDLRDMGQKYHQLQQKMEKVMESQNQLRTIEQNILNLGLHNNLVTNFIEIIKENKPQ